LFNPLGTAIVMLTAPGVDGWACAAHTAKPSAAHSDVRQILFVSIASPWGGEGADVGAGSIAQTLCRRAARTLRRA
jgi:hypothetical protein